VFSAPKDGRNLAHARMGILIRFNGTPTQRRILRMLAVRITGNQLRAGRALAGLTIEDLAARARLSRRSLGKWEGSSNATPSAMTDHLCRAIDVLESEGVRFSDSGVHLQRSAPAATIIHSEGISA
jgi:DNA-binding XRE family transcriptional regulator